MNAPVLTGRERRFDKDEIIVSKTDTKGRITYANNVFLSIADYTEAEVINQPHSILRHPEMPRCVFKLFWDTLTSNNEIFAYVINRTKYGDHYWVLAHVTPTYGPNGETIEYHSTRRVPNENALGFIMQLYATLNAEEAKHANAKEGMNAGTALLHSTLEQQGKTYLELIYELEGML